jgi:ABC-type transporter Mla subunit MlaD
MALRYKSSEIMVGVFLVLAIAVVIAVIIMIGSERRWFEKRYEFTTKFLRAEGVSPGMPVAIKGIQVGEVQSVYLNEDNWIEVTFTVFQEYTERIRKDSVVKLRSPLIGSKALDIIPGGNTMPVLASGSYVWSDDTEQGQRILAQRQRDEKPDQLQRVLNNVERLTYNLSAPDGSLEPALNRITYFFDKLSSDQEDLQMMLANLERITGSIDVRQGSIGKLMDDDYELYTSLTELMDHLNLMVANLQEFSGTLADSSPEIEEAISRSNRTMNEAIGLIKTLQNNFFVRGFSSRKNQAPLPIEGAEREGGYDPYDGYAPLGSAPGTGYER